MANIVIDPITRIEGHLRIQVETDSANTITRASSSSVSMRGIETILAGRDPRDAWAITQRICGVCTLVHGIASVRAIENTLNIQVPKNAQIIRNLMIAAQTVHDHVMHFYHLHALDWVDVVSAANADPAATATLQKSLSAWPNNTAAYFAGVQTKLKNLLASGQYGIFANGYWGHPEMKLPATVNLLAFAHYLEALAWQRDVAKLLAVFGGKNPHPNLVVGGVGCAISVDQTLSDYAGGKTAVNAAGLALVSSIITKMQDFVNQVYLPDTLAIAGYYKEYAEPGFGENLGNFMVFGEFPDPVTGVNKLPGGVILNRDLSSIQPVNLQDVNEITESVAHSWYNYTTASKYSPLHPSEGETTPAYTGPTPPFAWLPDGASDSYSWVKAPRWKGQAVEVGPLARVLVMYAKGETATRALVTSSLSKLGLTTANLYSTLGRVLARTIETKVIADWMPAWYNQLLTNIRAGDFNTFNEVNWNPATWPNYPAPGVGYTEAPRGALGHWVTIEAGRIKSYQIVVPSTWNASPRDETEQPGAYEAALVGHTLADPGKPLEILRTIHSFDPCIGCAVHLVGPDGQEMLEIKVQ